MMNKDRTKEEQLSKSAAGAADAVRRRTMDAAGVLRYLVFGGASAACGYLLGACALPFGCYPLGIAWLCATERHVPWVLVGVLAAGLGLPNPAIWALALLVALVIRAVVRLTLDPPRDGIGTAALLWRNLFSEQVGLRMATACVTAFFVGVVRLIEGGFLYYDLYGTLLSMAVAPVAVLLFFGASRRESGAWGRVHMVGLLSLLCAVVYAARDLRVAYLSVSAFVAMTATLLVVKRRGLAVGIAAGALLGLAYMPVMAPLFALGALCCGVLFPLSIPLGSTMFIIVGIAWAFYTRGLAALSGLIPALLSAGVLFAVVDKLFLETEAKAVDESREEETACEAVSTDRARLDELTARIGAVRETFLSMARTFEAMADAHRRPSAEDLRVICESAFDSSCASCEARESCRAGCASEIDAEISYLSSVLSREGRVDAACVSQGLAGRCTRLPDMIDEINHNAATHAARVLQSDKSEIFAADYAAMAEILSETLAASEAIAPDEQACERFSVSFAQRTMRAVGEEAYCGDSACVFRRGGKQYALISDGMGSGREAALTSGLCVLFMQNLLGLCSHPETVLRMLNVFLRHKGGDSLHECSATVDLLAWDLCDGRAQFYKCGAAPTYVFRAGSLFKIRSKTLPIGILREVDQKRIDFALSAGDVIVMVSDGVTQGREECPWLYELLRQSADALDPDGTAERILHRAKAEGSVDDLSVLVLRVESV